MEEIKINTPVIKLNALLKLADVVASGGEAKYLILDGKVKVNGVVCEVVRKQLTPGDIISVDDNDFKIIN